MAVEELVAGKATEVVATVEAETVEVETVMGVVVEKAKEAEAKAELVMEEED